MELNAGGPELVQDVLHRVNGSVRPLRSLYSGSIEDVFNVLSAAAVRRKWRESSPMQRALVHRIWNRVAAWSARLPLVDGRQVSDQITRSVPEAWKASGKASREAEPQRGDVVELQPHHVKLPPEGASPVAVGEVAPDVMENLEHGDAPTLRADEDVDSEVYDAIKPYLLPEL